MALTINYEGTGILAYADAISDTAGGTWGNSGGGTTFDVNPDVLLYTGGSDQAGTNANSLGAKYASKSGEIFYDFASALNYTTGGAQEGELLYISVNVQGDGQFATIANNPFTFFIENSNGSNRIEWPVLGDGETNGWAGGWRYFVFDPNSTGIVASGTRAGAAGAATRCGFTINTDVSVRADSIFMSMIISAAGVRVTGTPDSNNGFEEINAWCTDYINRAFGLMEEREGVYYTRGKIIIGGTAATSFSDSGRIIKFETSEYYDLGNTNTWISTMPSDACGIVFEDNSGATTTSFVDGVLVGSNNGRSGSTIIGSDNELAFFDASGLSNASSDIKLYGTSLKQMEGAITFANDSDWAAYGATFQACAQIDPVGAMSFRNCTFAETAATDAAVLWNANADIQDCSFIANTNGAGIEITQTTNQTFTSLTFSGNTNDVLLNNGGTSIDVSNASGSNASTYTNIGGGVVTFTVSATLTINNLFSGSEVRVHRLSDGTELAGIETVSQSDPINSGRFQFQYSYTTAEAIYVVVMNLGYQHQKINYTLGGVDESLLVSQVIDRNYSNP